MIASSAGPTSTYRLHLTHADTLHDAAALVDHVAALGIGWLYASPIQTVPAGATHGYHILDPDQVNPELGGEAGLSVLRRALDAEGLGLILDIVPNHLGATPDNAWWRDLLRHGADSAHATTFDVDLGDPPGSRKIVLPVLGAPLDDAIAAGDITVDGEDLVLYGETRLPLAPDTDPTAPLTDVLAAQHYELHLWTQGQRVLNWRRFFAVNELVGIRVEDPRVFDDSHHLIARLVADGVVQGLRVDHVDGLAAPGAYLDRLRELAGPDTWLLVEKIVEREESLPPGWPVAGTTGYEVANLLQQWLLDREGYDRLVQAFEARTDLRGPVTDALPASKLHVLHTLFPADVETVRRRLGTLPGVPDEEVAEVLAVMAAHLEGYRTYTEPGGSPGPHDAHRWEQAVAAAQVTHGRAAIAVATALHADQATVMRWQQLTGPAAAKGFEDRLLYRHVALASLCEVGADAATLDDPWGPDRVVQGLAAMQAHAPGAGATTSTHDTKRAEDVRAVLHALAEVPEAFVALLNDLDDLDDLVPAEGSGSGGADQRIDAHAAWLLTQTAVALLALDRQPADGLLPRLQAYAVKALREAEVHTGHAEPDAAYEAGVGRWLAWLLAEGPSLEAVGALAAEVRVPGLTTALATTLLKLVGPGVPDVYRGTEIWDDSLVDPDNRRPLDLAALRAALVRSQVVDDAPDPGTCVADLREGWTDGALKLHVTRTGLHLRRRRPEVFARGRLAAPGVEGAAAAHVAAIERTDPSGGAAVVGVATRMPYGLAGSRWAVGEVWGDTVMAVPGETVTDLLTRRTIPVVDGRARLADVLAVLPVAILECA